MISCRGRNKWFNLKEASAYPLGEEIAVSLQSKRQYMDMPPIYFSGPKAEMVDLLGSLKAMAEGGPCGMFELRGAGNTVELKCSGGTNSELCAYCHHKMEEEVLINEYETNNEKPRSKG